MDDGHRNLLIGQAGVWRVASEIATRGVVPMFPGIDVGADLHTTTGCRIQVKTTKMRKHERVYPEGAYWFKFSQAPIVTGGNNIRRRGQRDYSKCSDVMVLWGRDEDRFWILPSALVATTQCLILGPKGFYKRSEFTEAAALKEQGLKQREIGELLGISQAAVSYQLRGGREKMPRRTVAAQAREYEGRWDLILNFGQAEATEAPRVGATL